MHWISSPTSCLASYQKASEHPSTSHSLGPLIYSWDTTSKNRNRSTKHNLFFLNPAHFFKYTNPILRISKTEYIAIITLVFDGDYRITFPLQYWLSENNLIGSKLFWSAWIVMKAGMACFFTLQGKQLSWTSCKCILCQWFFGNKRKL